jgi:hypothetical protein
MSNSVIADDEINDGRYLKNGWVLEDVVLSKDDPKDDVRVFQMFPRTAHAFVKFRWMAPQHERVKYSVGVLITGPKGVPFE